MEATDDDDDADDDEQEQTQHRQNLGKWGIKRNFAELANSFEEVVILSHCGMRIG